MNAFCVTFLEGRKAGKARAYSRPQVRYAQELTARASGLPLPVPPFRQRAHDTTDATTSAAAMPLSVAPEEHRDNATAGATA